MCWFNCWILFAKYYQTKKRRSIYSRWWNREDRRFAATVIRWSSVQASRNRSWKCRTWSSIIPYESSQFRLSCSRLVISCFEVVLLCCCGMDGQYSVNYCADMHLTWMCRSSKHLFTWLILLLHLIVTPWKIISLRKLWIDILEMIHLLTIIPASLSCEVPCRQSCCVWTRTIWQHLRGCDIWEQAMSSFTWFMCVFCYNKERLNFNFTTMMEHFCVVFQQNDLTNNSNELLFCGISCCMHFEAACRESAMNDFINGSKSQIQSEPNLSVQQSEVSMACANTANLLPEEPRPTTMAVQAEEQESKVQIESMDTVAAPCVEDKPPPSNLQFTVQFQTKSSANPSTMLSIVPSTSKKSENKLKHKISMDDEGCKVTRFFELLIKFEWSIKIMQDFIIIIKQIFVTCQLGI